MGQYLPVVTMAVLAILFAAVSLLMSKMLAPRRSTTAKRAPYESGIIPDPSTDVRGTRFPVKFYLVAMLFIIFDVEAVFLYPWAVSLRSLGWYGFAVMAVFVLLLFESYYYILRRGGLEWD